MGPEEHPGDRSRYNRLDLENIRDNEKDITEIVQDIKSRYMTSDRDLDEADLEAADADISRQSLLPTVKDPTLFSVKCRVRFACSGCCALWFAI